MRLLFAAAVASSLLIAQPPAPPAAVKDVRETPRGSLMGYLGACRDNDYRRAASFLNFKKEQRRFGTPEYLAEKLREILDRKLSQDPNTVSNAPEGDLTDGLEPNLESFGTIKHADRNVDLILERVQLPEVGQIWLVSSNTIGLIPILQDDVSSNAIERYLPEWMTRNKMFDTALWQWIALALLTLVALALGHVLARIAIRSVGPLVRRTQSGLDDALVATMRRPLQVLIALAAYRAGIVWIAPSYLLRTYLGRVLTGVIYLSIAWVVLRLIDVITTKLLAAMSGRQKTSVASTMPLTRRSLKALAVLIAILATLSSWGYDTTALLAGLGVGGLAVALAAQKTLENLFGGIAITTDKPVLVGDFCRYGDKIGTVEDIGLRSTRIRSLDRTVVTVPNAEFSSLQIENFGRRDKMSFRPVLQLRRDTTPEQLRALLPRLRQLLLDHPQIERTPRVRLLKIGDFSLDVEIFSYVLTPDYDEFLLRQEEILLRLLEIVAEEGAALAIPARLNVVSRDKLRDGPDGAGLKS
jgi:MscS family membrane protein